MHKNENKEIYDAENVEMITISREKYDDMIERLDFLSCLEAAGVDNWQGFDDAHQMMNETKG